MWEKRQLGRTKLQVTTLGLGTATMGGSRIPITQLEGQAIVQAAWDAGVRYVDTAPFYGVGAAEHRVGDALRGWAVVAHAVQRRLRLHPRRHYALGRGQLSAAGSRADRYSVRA